MSLHTLFFSSLLLVSGTAASMASPQLVMVEEDGCIWCARWNKEISEIYPKTPEGKAAPLRRMDLHATRPEDLTFERGLFFTPTFVLVVDGKEISRLEGYPGEDFFWGLLSKMLNNANIEMPE